MAFKQVQDLGTDVTISLGGFNKKDKKDNPTSIEGYFLGSREVADKKKKSGVSYIHVFKTKKGNVGVWGKTDLDRKLASAPVGSMIRASFDKMVPTPNGDMYKFTVEFDDENTIEVQAPRVTASANLNANSSGSDEEIEEQEEEGAEELEKDEEPEVDEEALAEARALAAARKAKVDAILNKGKSAKKTA